MPESRLNRPGVLVTRPAHQAKTLCRLIEQSGARAIPFPLIEIVPPKDEAGAKQLLKRLADFDIVIFISANAVHQCYIYIGKAWPEGGRIACVGQATAQQLQTDFGRKADLVPNAGYNSEALLALPALQDVKGRQILIIKGENGRQLLGDSLADRGANVSYANLYRRRLPNEAAKNLLELQSGISIDVAVFTSGEAIHNLLSLLDKTSKSWLDKITCLVIHPRLAEILQQAKFKGEIIISDGPGNEQVVQCLKQWALQRT